VIISRVCRISKWIALAGIVAACASAPPATIPAIPTFSGGTSSPPAPPTSTPLVSTAAPTRADFDRTWAEQPFGADKVVVTFYADANGGPCVRYTIGARSNANCLPSKVGTLLAVQGIEADSTGSEYSIVAGRTFTDKITAVSLEFTDNGNTHAEVNDGGFIVIMEGKRTALWAIPIDQYGNLVGDKFTFKR
jgi:hypothetical protein